MYGRIINGTGWTFPEVDAMAVTDAQELLEVWRDDPPLSEMVKVYLGFKPAAEKPKAAPPQPEPLTEEQFRDVVEGNRAEVQRFGGQVR